MFNSKIKGYGRVICFPIKPVVKRLGYNFFACSKHTCWHDAKM